MLSGLMYTCTMARFSGAHLTLSQCVVPTTPGISYQQSLVTQSPHIFYKKPGSTCRSREEKHEVEHGDEKSNLLHVY
jgi:hypothetical protein